MADPNILLQRAIKICISAHKSQTDKAGEIYCLHPMRISFYFDDIDQKIVALLHDTIEDSNYTFHDLRYDQFSEKVLDALAAITRREKESYDDYIIRLSKNDIAKKVKIRDLIDNMDLGRFKEKTVTKEMTDRYRKYEKALNFLEEQKAA